ncbi:MAG: hypothetical protein WC979_03300 [Candidatus Pacearchaeota archaeon]|jgi:hypothetical protein|nr:hypothetical protein [Clostridia bacterium]
MKKHKRVIHIDNQEWFWWVGSGRFGEATHVTISSPDKKFFKIDAREVATDLMYVGVEGLFPTAVKPSSVKDYIIAKLKVCAK